MSRKTNSDKPFAFELPAGWDAIPMKLDESVEIGELLDSLPVPVPGPSTELYTFTDIANIVSVPNDLTDMPIRRSSKQKRKFNGRRKQDKKRNAMPRSTKKTKTLDEPLIPEAWSKLPIHSFAESEADLTEVDDMFYNLPVDPNQYTDEETFSDLVDDIDREMKNAGIVVPTTESSTQNQTNSTTSLSGFTAKEEEQTNTERGERKKQTP
eukprot:TRINITY_DN3080_c0_g1_i1.p1 TRINITY_DN3080_c0_g1~~TRINITY_DN3080_c0_g1_i1.p1  ORF type:complete len:210 (+),score=50.11 TRINITY_DN3080_c0_g1_i1:50-679(+)